MRVLVVDDHEVVRRGLRAALADDLPGIEVGEAGDSRAAMQAIAEQGWDLVILDIDIPGRTGLEVLQDLRQQRPQTPVLILSGYPEEDYAVRAFRLGAAGYLAKSQMMGELLGAVRRVLAGGRYVSAAMAERLAATVGQDLQAAPHDSLSNRELQVLKLVASGKTTREIADGLALSEKTIGTYRLRISEKLGMSSNVELTRYAMRHRLVE